MSCCYKNALDGKEIENAESYFNVLMKVYRRVEKH